MIKDEKKILNSDTLEMPNKSVIDDARSQMVSKRAINKHTLKNVLISFATLAVTALVLVISIPYMIPANNNDPNYVSIDEMTVESIISVEQYNQEKGTNIFHFDNAKNSTAYYYEDKVMIIEENSIVNDTSVSVLVLFCENTLSYNFEILNDKAQILPDTTHHNINGIAVQKSTSAGKTFLHFSVDNYKYYLEIAGANADWQTIFDEFVN